MPIRKDVTLPSVRIDGVAWHGRTEDEKYALLVLESERGQIALKIPREAALVAALAEAAVRIMRAVDADQSGTIMAHSVDRFSTGHSPDAEHRVILSLGQGSAVELDSYVMPAGLAKQMGAALVREGVEQMKGLPPTPQDKVMAPLPAENKSQH